MFSIKERVFPYTLGTFSIKESLLVLRYNSYNAVERVFPYTLGIFSIKRERVYRYSGAQFIRFWMRKIECLLVVFGQELDRKYRSLESRAYIRQEHIIFTIIRLL
jgi:hypothetical protein